jgi:hypothetical protein
MLLEGKAPGVHPGRILNPTKLSDQERLDLTILICHAG